MEKSTDLEVILGGVTVVAKLRDASIEEVKVRQLPIRLLTTKWAQSLGDEAALVELYCDKPEGWDDQLLAESHEEIIRIGEALNFPKLSRFAEAQRATVAKMTVVTSEIQTDPASKSSSTPVA
jgi:hypothetical protein